MSWHSLPPQSQFSARDYPQWPGGTSRTAYEEQQALPSLTQQQQQSRPPLSPPQTTATAALAASTVNMATGIDSNQSALMAMLAQPGLVLCVWIGIAGLASLLLQAPVDSPVLGIVLILYGGVVWVRAIWYVASMINYVFNESLSIPRQLNDLQQRALVIERAVSLFIQSVLGAAVIHHGLFLVDNASSPGLVAHVAAGSTPYTRHLYLVVLTFLNTLTQGYGGVTQPQFEFVVTPAAQLWSIVVTSSWIFQMIGILATVPAIELARRERRRDHDPETI